jgi:antirestriction protein
MKIVINRCFGGFGLSPKALLWLHEKGATGISSPVKHYYGGTIDNGWEEKYQKNLSKWKKWKNRVSGQKRDSLFITVFSPDDNYVLFASEIKRDDPLIVECVEKLGEDSWGACAELAVIEIPDGVEYEIDDYDGMESIHEQHRSWS